MTHTTIDPIYRHKITVSPQALDQNGHVNNVQYVRWMQEIAIAHYEQIGGLSPTQAHGATWVVRSHHVEYFHPAFFQALEPLQN